MKRQRTVIVPIACLLAFSSALMACSSRRFDASRATHPYPARLHQTQAVDIHLFRDGTQIEITNSTARSYRDFDLWINQRYVRHVDALPTGQRVRLSLWDFFDERGEGINAGGLFRTYPPTPVRLAEIQVDDQSPLVGLISIPEIDSRQ